MLRTISKWVLRILGLLLAVIGAWATYAGSRPVLTEPLIPDEEAGAGSRSVVPSYTGLLREFPEIETPDDAAVELGRQLFFDPVLSAENDMSCATCHQPDHGFSDGLGACDHGPRSQHPPDPDGLAPHLSLIHI